MEYTGLIDKFKINRQLTEEEEDLRLISKKRLDINLSHQLCVIKTNSIYIEIHDKYYSWKGLLSSLSLFIILLFGGSIVKINLIMFLFDRNKHYMAHPVPVVLSSIAIFIISAPLFWAAFWLLRKESFRWTHYPIRLNRKNRTVYVFRLDGTVLSVPWDEVFFTLGRGGKFMGIESWDLRAHVLAKDRKTVLETFAFGYTSTTQDNVRALWEYLRRYMEDGPKEPYDLLDYCLPIDQKKEPRLLGLQCLWLDLNGQLFFQVLLIPMFLFTWLGRQFAMATCRTPVWPDDVEAACAIESGDPYVKDGRTNPPDAGLWFP